MSRDGRFSSALREDARKRIEQLGAADIVVGIPCYYNDTSVAHVITQVADGLRRHYPDQRALVLVADGGSTDDTREIAQELQERDFNLAIIVTIYRGVPGKGSALRAIFEASRFLRAKAVAVFDSDLKSISHGWIKNVLEPVFAGYDFVAPDYSRYKLDGTITNTIAYNLTRALYGVNIRQPIGGDFGMSLPLVRHYLDREEVWESDIAKFGVDIWMTTTAIIGGFKLCQAKLGAKIHGEKDPAADLGPMFREVVGTIFALMEENVPFWSAIAGKTVTPPSLGEATGQPPEVIIVDYQQLVDYFRSGYRNFGSVWKNIIEPEDFKVLESLARSRSKKKRLILPLESWVRIVYRYAAYCSTAERQRMKIIDTMIPLYNAEVASLVAELENMSHEEAEAYYDNQARMFEKMKPYLLDIWPKKEPEPVTAPEQEAPQGN